MYLISSSGYVLASLGTFSLSFTYSHGWLKGEDNYTDPSWFKSSLQNSLTTITCVGAMIAAFTAGNFIKYGKWRMIIISEMLLIVSAGLCLINNYWIIFVGRFFWGMTAGALNCYTPAFISEIAPNEYKGPFGVIN